MGVESQSRILGLFWSTPQELNIKEHCSFIFDPSQELPHFMALAQVKTIQAHQDSMHEQYIYIYTYVYIYTYIQRIYIIYINIYTYIYMISRDVAASVLKSICAKNCVSLLGYGLGARNSSSAGSETESLESIRIY